MRNCRWTVLGIVTIVVLAGCAGGPLARSGLLNRVMYLDGKTGYVEVPYSSSLDISQNLTIEAWFNVESFPDCTDLDQAPAPYCLYSPILGQPNPTSAIGNYLLAVAQDAIIFGFEPTTYLDVRMHATVPATSGWHHVAVVHAFGRQAATSLFLDGVAVAGEWVAGSGDETAYPNPGKPYLIGRFGVPEGYFHGMLDDVRIWRVIRTQEEIRATMNIELKGNEAGLAAYWKFDEPAGSLIAYDSSSNGNDGGVRGGAQIRVSQTAGGSALESR